ncbi:hypothetical protein [Haladaptatus sp. CMSO5]|uniref:hypothetical protein n=1 Tax=Haladaptatus sp. CMSO5 TaxID=3120514 RepID=UPI002FCE2FB6
MRETGGMTMSRIKLGAFYLAVLITLGMFVLFTGELFMLLGLGFGLGQELGIHQLHVMGIAIVVFFGALTMLVQLYKPVTRVAAFQAGAVMIGIATLILALTGNASLSEVLPFFVAFVVVGLLHPAGRKLLTVGKKYSPALLGLTIVAAIPLLAFVINQLGLQTGAGDEHALMGHYAMMATLSLTIVIAGLLVAFESIGFRLLAWLLGVLTAYFGLLSVVLPIQASNVGVLWGGLTIVWAIVFVAVAEMSARENASSYFSRELRERDDLMPGKPAG